MSAEGRKASLARDVLHGQAVAGGLTRGFVRHLFSEIDVNGDGRVDRGELTRLGELLGERWDEGTIDALFHGADVDADGSLDFEELHRFLAAHVSRVGADGQMRWQVPASSVESIDPAFFKIFETLDLRLGHRADLVEGGACGLESHLVSVYTILREFGAPPHVCTAGLFHSVYEVGEHHACSAETDRPRLQEAIGLEAEHLVYLFPTLKYAKQSTAGKVGLWDAPADAPFVLPGRLFGQGEEVECDPTLRGPLVTLFWVNMIDQANWNYGDDAEDLVSSAELVLMYNTAELLPLYVPGLQAWWQRHLARAAAVDFGALFARQRNWLVEPPGYWARKTEAEKDDLRAQLRQDLDAYAARHTALVQGA